MVLLGLVWMRDGLNRIDEPLLAGLGVLRRVVCVVVDVLKEPLAEADPLAGWVVYVESLLSGWLEFSEAQLRSLLVMLAIEVRRKEAKSECA